jgi:hypothetical protein
MFGRRPKRAAVLGCGPAGLFAAHGLIEAGWEVDIYSNKRRSEMFGAQYLHAPIHGLIERSTVLEYTLRGTVEEYKRKVYGNISVESVSPEQFLGQHAAWDIRAAYIDAWDAYSDLIEHTPGLGAVEVKEIIDSKRYRAVVSSIPAKDFCYGMHRFASRGIWAIGDAPERGIFTPMKPAGRDMVMCDGTKDRGWYRASNVFGYNTIEWPGDRKPPLDGITGVIKPTKTDCDCWMDTGIYHRVGRYGTWTKGVLAHEAYTAMKGVK